MDTMHPAMQEQLRKQETTPATDPAPAPAPVARPADPWAEYDRRAVNLEMRSGGGRHDY